MTTASTEKSKPSRASQHKMRKGRAANQGRVRSDLRAIATFALLVVAFTSSAGALPDPTVTPGAIDPAVTQQNLAQTICHKGYTSIVRPRNPYTNALKKKQLAEGPYANPGARADHYEEDHLIPLEIGGHPSDPRNLWPEPWGGDNNAAIKDRCENLAKRMVCRGEQTLAEAQQGFAVNWIDYCQQIEALDEAKRAHRAK